MSMAAWSSGKRSTRAFGHRDDGALGDERAGVRRRCRTRTAPRMGAPSYQPASTRTCVPSEVVASATIASCASKASARLRTRERRNSSPTSPAVPSATRPEQVAPARTDASSASSRPVKARTPSADRSDRMGGGHASAGPRGASKRRTPLRSASSGPRSWARRQRRCLRRDFQAHGRRITTTPGARLGARQRPRRWPTRRRRRCSGRCASTWRTRASSAPARATGTRRARSSCGCASASASSAGGSVTHRRRPCRPTRPVSGTRSSTAATSSSASSPGPTSRPRSTP